MAPELSPSPESRIATGVHTAVIGTQHLTTSEGNVALSAVTSDHVPLPEDAFLLPDELHHQQHDSTHFISALRSTREGSTLTVNASIQGEVTAVNPVEDTLAARVQAAQHPDDETDSGSRVGVHFEAYTVSVRNPDTPDICVARWGGSVLDDFAIGMLPLPPSANVDDPEALTAEELPVEKWQPISHLCVDNESNLPAEICTPRYEAFRQAEGSLAIAVNDSQLHICSIDTVEDGCLTAKVAHTRLHDTTVVTGDSTTEYTWVSLETAPNSLPSGQLIHGASDPVSDSPLPAPERDASPQDQDHSSPFAALPTAQRSALIALTHLPEGSYTITEDGLRTDGITVLGSDALSQALPYLNPEEHDHLSSRNPLPDTSPVHLDDPVTDVTGVGNATCVKLEGGRKRWRESQQTFKSRIEDCDFIDVGEAQHEDEIKAAQQNRTTPVRESRWHADNGSMTVREFLTDHAGFTTIANRYRPDAVAGIRAGLSEAIRPLEDSSIPVDGRTVADLHDRAAADAARESDCCSVNVNLYFLLHAALTRGRLYNERGEPVGTYVDFFTGQCDITAVRIAGAAGVVPTEAPDSPAQPTAFEETSDQAPDRLHAVVGAPLSSVTDLTIDDSRVTDSGFEPTAEYFTANSVTPSPHSVEQSSTAGYTFFDLPPETVTQLEAGEKPTTSSLTIRTPATTDDISLASAYPQTAAGEVNVDAYTASHPYSMSEWTAKLITAVVGQNICDSHDETIEATFGEGILELSLPLLDTAIRQTYGMYDLP